MVTACKCFVPESDRWYLCFPPALTVELSKLNMNNGPTIFWLNHSTNIRQYSISTVTVKLCGQLAEVERVLPLVFCRRGVQFAAFEPLADEVA